jgi:hypothetical protein
MGTDETPARSISKPSIDIAMTRKAGHKESTFRWVDVTTAQDTEKRGEEKFSAPFWSSGRRSDPPADCDGDTTVRENRRNCS